MESMKIAMFTDAYWPRVNGVTVSVDSYARALIKAGHEVLIICSRYLEDYNSPISILNKPETGNGPQIIRVPSVPSLVSKEDRIAKFNKWLWVFKQIELFGPDIIHVHTEFMIAEFGFSYAYTHGLPSVYTFHTMWEDYGPNYFSMIPPFLVKFVIRGLLRRLLNRAYRVIVPTPQIDEVVHKYTPRAKTFLLPTGIDPELFTHNESEAASFREKLQEHFPRIKGKRILLFAGRVAKEKNIGFLIRILPEILARHPDIMLLIAGSGPDADYFQDEARKAGMEEACVFTGYLERKDLSLMYMLAEVFVFPSLTDTQGLVTLEAMFSGTPVVAIGVLGTRMIMEGDKGGFMVANNPAEFTARVLELLENPELRRFKSNEAKIHARAWSLEELTKKLLSIYQSTAQDYQEEHNAHRSSVWETLMDKKRQESINKIFRKKASRKWQEILAKLGLR